MTYKDFTRPKIIEAIFLDYIDFLREGLGKEKSVQKVMNKYYKEERIRDGDTCLPLHKHLARFLVEKGYVDNPGDGNSLTMEDHEKMVDDEIMMLIGIHDIDDSVVDKNKFTW